MMRLLLVTAGGLGLMRPFPGTWGSLPPAAIAWIMLLAGASLTLYHAVIGALLIGACVICIALGGWAEGRFHAKDPSQVVIDEVAGQALALLLLPDALHVAGLSGFWPITLSVGGAFVLFRAMDILKPPPAHALQRLPAGWGVLTDDLFAGAYAAILLTACIWLLR